KTVYVPVVSPEVVIQSPYPTNQVASSFTLWGKPYFFNVGSINDLDFLWDINGELPQNISSPEVLNVALKNPEKGTSFPVTLSIKNPSQSAESAIKTITLTIK